MSNLKHAWLLAAMAMCACGGPQPERGTVTSTAPVADAVAASSDGAPAPAVSHPSNVASAESSSTAAHHSDPPSSGPTVDPVKAPELDPNNAAPPRTAREVVIPAGTSLSLQLASAVTSDRSHVEDPVRATLRRGIVVDGVTVVPAGTAVTGYVTEAAESGRVKGRARLGVRFTALQVGDTRYPIRTSAVTREARATKKADAAKIGIGAGAGAVVGAIAGGKNGAAVGGAVGAAGGTGVVLATRGEEVALTKGTVVTPRLSAPVTVRIH
jgi:hypothetical protein